jgi:hypothetical protein
MATATPLVAAGDILEAAVAFFVSIQNGSTELERHPSHRPVEGFVPGPAFEKLNWKA